MTHDELISKAYRWLLGTMKCMFVLSEIESGFGERPDAIGFKWQGSYLVECKANRADFLSDKKKHFRKDPGKGLGDYRFYMCPKGMIQPEELPGHWGLLWAYPRIVKVVKPAGDWRLKRAWYPPGNGPHPEYKRPEENRLQGEYTILVSALHRLSWKMGSQFNSLLRWNSDFGRPAGLWEMKWEAKKYQGPM